jgi:hypothetical protein
VELDDAQHRPEVVDILFIESPLAWYLDGELQRALQYEQEKIMKLGERHCPKLFKLMHRVISGVTVCACH